MDSSTIIIAIVFIAICILPFVLIGKNRSKNKKQMLRSIAELAKSNESNIEYNIFNDTIIGFDSASNSILFLKKRNDISHCIKLSEVKQCVVHTTNQRNSLVDKVGLLFSFIQKEKSEIFIELYNSAYTMQLSGELQLAEKWEGIINKKLKMLTLNK